MKMFVSTFTVYRYNNRYRQDLNIEEAKKFAKGLNNARGPDAVILFTDSGDYLHDMNSAKELTEKEITHFNKFVIEPLEYLKSTSDVEINYINTNLTDFFEAYDRIYRYLLNRIVGKDMEIEANLSCGHKIGALALYVALLNINREKHGIFLHPYHAEGEIVEDFPVVNIRTSMIEMDAEQYLYVFEQGISYEDAKREIMNHVYSPKDAERIIISLMKRKLIETRDDSKIVLTVRGKTLFELTRAM